MVIERLELDLDICRLHNFVNLAVLLSTDEFPMFICEFNLEANLVMKSLKQKSQEKNE